MARVFGIGISYELREECVALIYQFEELGDPDKLRAFASVRELELVYKCIPSSAELRRDALVNKLLMTGKSELEPALFALLDALARRYREDSRGEQCQQLKEKIRNELHQSGSQEQQAKDYQRLVEKSTSGDGSGVDKLAEQWIEEATDDPDELALRVSLAVFSGTTFEVIERAKNDLVGSFRQLFPPPPLPNPEDPPPVVTYVPLMRRLQNAGAREKAGEAPTWKRAIVLEKEQADFSSEAIRYVWQQYHETESRKKLIEWLTTYVVGQSAEVRTRAAVAVGLLAIQDYRFVIDHVLKRWAEASADKDIDNRKASEYRMAIGMALGVLAREENWRSEVQGLVWKWAESPNRAERWAAVRAYIYVGTYCQPIREVIMCWRKIAAAEFMAVYIEVTESIKVRLNNPIHMSLMDAMVRFFVIVAQQPTKEKRPRFVGILEGLNTWIADKESDSGLGLFMFSTLGRLMVTHVGTEEVDSPPLLLALVEEQPAQTDYRKQLAELFKLLMDDGDTVIEARDLLCTWLRWVDDLQDNSQLYETRLQNLLRDIVAADRSGRMRGKLVACLRDCGRNQTLDRVLSGL